MKLTSTQLRNLERLAKEGDLDMREWGVGFGLRRPTIKSLSDLGLVQYDPSNERGIACGMTQAGYDHLKALAAAPAKVIKLTPMDQKVLVALVELDSLNPKERGSSLVARVADIQTSSRSETAARHLIRLVEAGLAERHGPAGLPQWHPTEAGIAAAKELTRV